MPYGRWFVGISCIVSMLSMSPESKLSTSFKLSTVATKWVVGGLLNFFIARIPSSLTVVRPGLS